MIRLAWATDVHLVFPEDEERFAFYRSVRRPDIDAVVLSGDVGEGPKTLCFLREMAAVVRRPIYFVPGNHDYYRSSIRFMRQALRHFCRLYPLATCLNDQRFVSLSPEAAIVGHECWGDARLGDFETCRIVMNDWKVIEELQHWRRGPQDLAGLRLGRRVTQDLMQWNLGAADVDRAAVQRVLQSLGDEAAEHLAKVLPAALADHRLVIAVTHAPPFAHVLPVGRRLPEDEYLPIAICKAAGDVILRIMEAHPDRQLLVLSGHVHQEGDVRVSENIRMLVGDAEIGEPRIHRILELEGGEVRVLPP